MGRRNPLKTRAFQRQDTVCAIKDLCGACRYVNSHYESSLDEKTEAGLKILREAGVMDEARVMRATPSPKPLEYRSLFKLAVRKGPDWPEGPRKVDIGLFQPKSHRVINIDECPLHLAAEETDPGTERRHSGTWD